LFAGGGNFGRGLTARQYARLVGEWLSNIGLDPLTFGTHLRRRTKAANKTGILLNQQGRQRSKGLTSRRDTVGVTVRAGGPPK
jgi:hypothetical protein